MNQFRQIEASDLHSKFFMCPLSLEFVFSSLGPPASPGCLKMCLPAKPRSRTQLGMLPNSSLYVQSGAHPCLPALNTLPKLPRESVLEEGTLVQTDYLSMHILLTDTWPYIALAFTEPHGNILARR